MMRTIPTLALAGILLGSCGDASDGTAPSDEAMNAENSPATPIGLEIQGHRGCRGLLPENTVAGFVLAIREGADVLEMDLCISGDGQVIVSHEPWMSHEICSTPDGDPISQAEERQFNLHQMNTKRIQEFGCGAVPHPRFPEQRQLPVHKPTLEDVVKVTETVPKLLEGQPIRYNMEIKYHPDLDPVFCPNPETFAGLVLAEVNRLGIAGRTCIQSFSPEVMEEIHRQAPDIATAWLTETEGSVEDQLDRLTFQPDIYSPNWKLINAEDVHALQQQGIRVIPWTVNDQMDLFQVTEMGVDGIITDYPDRLYAMRK